MSEYIEREAVMKTARDGYHSDFGRSMADLTSLRELLEDTPSADVVEVVRCKNCQLWNKQSNSLQGRCPLLGNYPTGNWFCANGIRKDDESNA